MSSIFELLTSKEAIIIYIFIITSSFLCFIIYLVEKNNKKARLRHNTRELNKLVEEIQEEYPIEDNSVLYEEPILVEMKSEEASNVEELLESTREMEKIKIDLEKEENNSDQLEYNEPVIIEPLDDIVYEVEEEVGEELEYTSIEPDQATAQLELQKLTEVLKEQEEAENNQKDAISYYEEMQEETAIISLDELLKRGKELYESNEVTQYKDEGNEPISLQELEKTGTIPLVVDGTFQLQEVVPAEDVKEIEEERKKVTLYDFNTAPVKKEEIKEVKEVKRFKSSPIISPIYGIERENDNSMQLENTADYEKLDAEIRRTNEFIMTLKELQNNINIK